MPRQTMLSEKERLVEIEQSIAAIVVHQTPRQDNIVRPQIIGIKPYGCIPRKIDAEDDHHDESRVAIRRGEVVHDPEATRPLRSDLLSRCKIGERFTVQGSRLKVSHLNRTEGGAVLRLISVRSHDISVVFPRDRNVPAPYGHPEDWDATGTLQTVSDKLHALPGVGHGNQVTSCQQEVRPGGRGDHQIKLAVNPEDALR